METANHLYAIGIGSNRARPGDIRPGQTVCAAIARLERDFDLFDAASIVLNPAIGGAGREFANTAVIVTSDLEPEEMLRALQFIERDFGRRGGRRWGSRTLDLDILAWDGGTYHSRTLTIPHPRRDERAFALGPLAQIAPDWSPEAGPTLSQRLARLNRKRTLAGPAKSR